MISPTFRSGLVFVTMPTIAACVGGVVADSVSTRIILVVASKVALTLLKSLASVRAAWSFVAVAASAAPDTIRREKLGTRNWSLGSLTASAARAVSSSDTFSHCDGFRAMLTVPLVASMTTDLATGVVLSAVRGTLHDGQLPASAAVKLHFVHLNVGWMMALTSDSILLALVAVT